MLTWITSFMSGIWSKLIVIGAIIGTVVLAYLRVRKDGEIIQQNEDLKVDVKNAEVVTQVTKDISNLPDGDALKQLRSKWQR